MVRKPDPKRDSLIIPVATVVMVAWLLSLAYAVLANQFVPLTVVTPVMLLLAGYTFGVSIVKSAGGKNSE